jgi:glutamyl-tRNA synthetase/nondiscriminating glutamyl-tRNA synthetase
MIPDEHSEAPIVAANPFTADDVIAILRERGWLAGESSTEQRSWCERAASMLGGHAADRAGLTELLGLVFHYDAREIISKVESHVVLSRYAARGVIRQVALLLLDGAVLTSERFKEIVTALKDGMELRGRELFHPIRLALAGRAGEGELDRVNYRVLFGVGLTVAPDVEAVKRPTEDRQECLSHSLPLSTADLQL